MNEEARADAADPYEPPAIVYEASLEVRAGTPLGIVDALADPVRQDSLSALQAVMGGGRR